MIFHWQTIYKNFFLANAREKRSKNRPCTKPANVGATMRMVPWVKGVLRSKSVTYAHISVAPLHKIKYSLEIIIRMFHDTIIWERFIIQDFFNFWEYVPWKFFFNFSFVLMSKREKKASIFHSFQILCIKKSNLFKL